MVVQTSWIHIKCVPDIIIFLNLNENPCFHHSRCITDGTEHGTGYVHDYIRQQKLIGEF